MEKTKVITRETPNFESLVEEIRERFHGCGGNEESESHLCNNKQDLKEGYVYFWSNNKDVAKLITRSKKYILEVRDMGYAVQFKMAKEGFRNVTSAFKVS